MEKERLRLSIPYLAHIYTYDNIIWHS